MDLIYKIGSQMEKSIKEVMRMSQNVGSAVTELNTTRDTATDTAHNVHASDRKKRAYAHL